MEYSRKVLPLRLLAECPPVITHTSHGKTDTLFVLRNRSFGISKPASCSPRSTRTAKACGRLHFRLMARRLCLAGTTGLLWCGEWILRTNTELFGGCYVLTLSRFEVSTVSRRYIFTAILSSARKSSRPAFFTSSPSNSFPPPCVPRPRRFPRCVYAPRLRLG